MNSQYAPKNRAQRELRRAYATPVAARFCQPTLRAKYGTDTRMYRLLCGRGHPCSGQLGRVSMEELWDQGEGEQNTRVYPPKELSFYGFDDTGYYLSDRRNCKKSAGLWIGRRAFRPEGEETRDRGPRSLLPEWSIVEHYVLAPCDIWCPRCGTLNQVTIPSAADVR